MSNTTMNNSVAACHEKHEIELDDETGRSETKNGGMSQRNGSEDTTSGKHHDSLPPLQYDDDSDDSIVKLQEDLVEVGTAVQQKTGGFMDENAIQLEAPRMDIESNNMDACSGHHEHDASPGAFAVSGPDAPTDSDDDEYNTPTPSSSSYACSMFPVTTAKLVPGNEPDVVEALQDELEKVLAERENAAVAEIVDLEEELHRDDGAASLQDAHSNSEDKCGSIFNLRHRRTISIVVAAVLLATVGIVVPTVYKKVSSRHEPLAALLSSVSFDGGKALQRPSTPQSNAFYWLSGNSNLDSYSRETRIQRYVLATLYYSTSGHDWQNNTDWLSDTNECDWWNGAEGPLCSMDGVVVEVYLYNNSLAGTIPAELALLSSSLDELWLFNNGLTGTIPSEIMLLSHLNRLYLDSNALVGTIPPEIGFLSNLHRLYLHNNSMSGAVPSELSSLTNLNKLSLNINTLAGTISPDIGLLTNLYWLWLYNNSLTGTIPSNVGSLTNLLALVLNSNSLTGKIPSEIGLMRSLDMLVLDDNRLSGKVPSELGVLTKLVFLRLNNNELTGEFICPDFIKYCCISCDDCENDTCRSIT